jgi:hypothetical protein
MNASDIGKTKCTLHQSEAQRLLSWLKCYPVVGRENERKSLEITLEMALSLAGQRACTPDNAFAIRKGEGNESKLAVD